ncbi:class I SAM-dependent methyltransferase [Oceanicoccus sp. KOV_DT_Chl]|uniref:class I SAM-dependent methyltransferase n=1 Tax=Oceanicoccus sp. KOV_DT_Chl TaxID=1904639 RepID=UPI000C7A1CC3|nr:class I SAM-dependent methyltransferase [Oceanicoccus sp. KOV_DT_Chl]
MIINGLLTLACLLIPIGAEAGNQQNEQAYQQGRISSDGIGKYYMGREISHVMGHLGAGWLERPSREQEERTDLLLSNMGLKPTDVVVDLGAGTGYFSFPMATQVPQGKVLAVDIQGEMLDIIEQRKATQNISNIETIIATETQPNIPHDSTDIVLMVDAYHEFSYPKEVMQGVVTGLKPGGRVALVEYRGEDRNVPIKRLHKMTEKQAKKEMQAVGLTWIKTDNYLPQQHVMIFQKPYAPLNK